MGEHDKIGIRHRSRPAPSTVFAGQQRRTRATTARPRAARPVVAGPAELGPKRSGAASRGSNSSRRAPRWRCTVRSGVSSEGCNGKRRHVATGTRLAEPSGTEPLLLMLPSVLSLRDFMRRTAENRASAAPGATRTLHSVHDVRIEDITQDGLKRGHRAS